MNRYGTSLVTFDPKAEARLRRKIDFHVVPTVFLLYLFCFIDRANVGNARCEPSLLPRQTLFIVLIYFPY